MTGSPTITGTMWLGFALCGMPSASSRARSRATARFCAARSMPLAFRCRTAASAPAATAGGSAVVKMKPLAKLRTKSHIAADPAM